MWVMTRNGGQAATMLSANTVGRTLTVLSVTQASQGLVEAKSTTISAPPEQRWDG